MRQCPGSPIPNCIGAYILEHTPTGCCIVGQAADLLHAWSVLMTKLDRDMHECEELQDAYTKEPLVVFEFFACATWVEADAIVRKKTEERRLSGRLFEPSTGQLHPKGYVPHPSLYNA